MEKSGDIMDSLNLLSYCESILSDKKGEDILALDLRNLSYIADYFLVCTATSKPHLSALREWLKRKLREKFNIRPIAEDGNIDSEWIILDFGNIIVHIFTQEIRDRYQLEELWGDAERLKEILKDKIRKSGDN